MDGVDTSEWDCPCDPEDLEEYVNDEILECDVCSGEFQAGLTFYGVDGQCGDFDVCEACYTGAAADEDDGLSPEEVAARLEQLKMLEEERTKEQKAVKASAVHAGYTKDDGPKKRRDPLQAKQLFDMERVAARLMVLGMPDEKESYARVVKINRDGTVDLRFDMGKVQKGMHPDDIKRVGLAEEFVVDIQEDEEFKMELDDRHLDPHYALHAAKPGAHSIGYEKAKHESRIELNTSFRNKPKKHSECNLIGVFKKKPSDWIDSDIGNSFGVVLNPRYDSRGNISDVFANARRKEQSSDDKCHQPYMN